jgi:hypothetical protein
MTCFRPARANRTGWSAHGRAQSRPPASRPCRARRALLVAAAVGALSCDASAPIEPMPRETFIEVMAELRVAARTADAQPEFEQRRRQILEDAGVTDSALVAFVRMHGRDLPLLAEVWDSVEARIGARLGEDADR